MSAMLATMPIKGSSRISRVAHVSNQLLSRVVGLRLHSVQFVMDHVQLHFDGAVEDDPVLICGVTPTVEQAGRVTSPGELGYADALCSLILQNVVGSVETTGVGLRIDLEGGSVVLHPSREELVGPEIALLQGFADGEWMCWRPGEDSFEDLA